MKTYEKPRLMALSLSGNDRLCGDCAGHTTLRDRSDIAEAILEIVGIDPSTCGNSSEIDKGDFETVFSSLEACASPVSAYCKFASVTTVAWS